MAVFGSGAWIGMAPIPAVRLPTRDFRKCRLSDFSAQSAGVAGAMSGAVAVLRVETVFLPPWLITASDSAWCWLVRYDPSVETRVHTRTSIRKGGFVSNKSLFLGKEKGAAGLAAPVRLGLGASPIWMVSSEAQDHVTALDGDFADSHGRTAAYAIELRGCRQRDGDRFSRRVHGGG